MIIAKMVCMLVWCSSLNGGIGNFFDVKRAKESCQASLDLLAHECHIELKLTQDQVYRARVQIDNLEYQKRGLELQLQQYAQRLVDGHLAKKAFYSLGYSFFKRLGYGLPVSYAVRSYIPDSLKQYKTPISLGAQVLLGCALIDKRLIFDFNAALVNASFHERLLLNGGYAAHVLAFAFLSDRLAAAIEKKINS